MGHSHEGVCVGDAPPSPFRGHVCHWGSALYYPLWPVSPASPPIPSYSSTPAPQEKETRSGTCRLPLCLLFPSPDYKQHKLCSLIARTVLLKVKKKVFITACSICSTPPSLLSSGNLLLFLVSVTFSPPLPPSYSPCPGHLTGFLPWSVSSQSPLATVGHHRVKYTLNS